MDELKEMTLAQIIDVARLTKDPVAFGKQLLGYVSEQVSAAVREELADREKKVKEMKKESEVLQIAFDR